MQRNCTRLDWDFMGGMKSLSRKSKQGVKSSHNW